MAFEILSQAVAEQALHLGDRQRGVTRYFFRPAGGLGVEFICGDCLVDQPVAFGLRRV
jgi:hypothetical protein